MADRSIPQNFKNILHHTFGRLIVIARDGATGDGKARWRCLCECGTILTVTGKDLRSGNTQSCGCQRRDQFVAASIKRCTKHGHAAKDSKVYQAWISMKSRCYYPHNASYARYGGRGIQVCERWRDSFENFLADMGEPPTPQHSIDRIDNDGNYEPGNVRWATKIEQGHQSTNRMLTARGETLNIAEWGRRAGIGTRTIAYRLKIGWPTEAAIFTPVS